MRRDEVSGSSGSREQEERGKGGGKGGGRESEEAVRVKTARGLGGRGGGGEEDAEPASPPARSPRGRASALTLRGEGKLPGSREGGVVRPPMPPPPPGLALLLLEPPAPPSLSFPKPVYGRRPCCRALAPPYGKRSLMTSRDSRSLPAPPCQGPGPQGRPLGFGHAPPPTGAVQALAQKSQPGKDSKAKVT